jgi:hypothetical protein
MVLQKKKDKGHVRVGVCALLWDIWIVHNDFIFNKKSFLSFLHVIFLVTHLGFICGIYFSRRMIATTWILGASVWRWSHKIATSSAVDNLRGASQLDVSATIFRHL